MIVKNTQKGFTLIEIMIATAIFAIIMVMTTSVVSQSVGFQSKISAVRKTSQESRKLADMLSRDIQSAKGSTGTFKIAFNTGIGLDQTVGFKNGLGIFKCNYGGGCEYLESFLSGVSGANTIVISDGSKIKIYWFVRANAQAGYYYEYDATDLDSSSGLIKQSDGSQLRLDQIVARSSADIAGGDPTKNIIAGNVSSVHNDQTPDIKTKVNFLRFYCPSASVKKTQQVFLDFEVVSEIGTLSGKPSDHATSSIRTMVTTRGYSL